MGRSWVCFVVVCCCRDSSIKISFKCYDIADWYDVGIWKEDASFKNYLSALKINKRIYDDFLVITLIAISEVKSIVVVDRNFRLILNLNNLKLVSLVWSMNFLIKCFLNTPIVIYCMRNEVQINSYDEYIWKTWEKNF